MATASQGRPGRLGLLVDTSTEDRFLVDTGSVFSIIPHQSDLPPCGPKIVAADKSPIMCWGWRNRTIRAGGRRFSWNFLLAAVSFPIIGSDFLAQFNLMVDLARGRVQHGQKKWTIKLVTPPRGSTFAAIGVQPAECCFQAPVALSGNRSTTGADVNVPSGSLAAPVAQDRSAGPPSPSVDNTSTPSRASTPSLGCTSPPSRGGMSYADVARGGGLDYVAIFFFFFFILASFPEVLNVSKLLPPPKHHVQHFIETEGRPESAKYRRLDPSRLEAARAEFADMEKQGIIRRSKSHWSSPLHMVKKTDGTWRPCGDFRRLNLQTKPDRYTCPNMADLTARLGGCSVFTKLDLRKGYYQVPVRAQDVPKTAVVTPFGLFEFLRMPFGLRNAGQTFQRLMDEVLAGLPFVFCYLDDVLIASVSHQEHVAHLREVLTLLQQHGLVLNGEKCELGKSQVDYLGHHVSSTGIQPIPERVEAIARYPAPTSVQQLQTYLGMVNFYRRFIKGAARILKPLTDALRGGKLAKLQWSQEMEAAFKESKAALSAAAELAHPDSTAELVLAVDASGTHVGAVLQQRAGLRGLQPLGFFSQKLDKTQQKYSAFDRELLAAYLGIRHFRWSLEGEAVHLGDRPQAPHRCSTPAVGCLVSTPTEAVVLRGRVHVRCAARGWTRECGGGCAVTTSSSSGPSGGRCCGPGGASTCPRSLPGDTAASRPP